MSNKITKDGEYILLPVPEADLRSMARFAAHGLFTQDKTKLTNLITNIVQGNLSHQEEYVTEFIKMLDIENWWLVLSGPEALKLCDELAEKIYEPVPEKKKEQKLRLVTICVGCHRSRFKDETCEHCGVNK